MTIDTTRKLASVQVISDIHPIDGADSIVVATILGWHVIVKKDEFVIGDKIVYCEVDSLLPEKPEFEFLRSKKFRIKTIELRKTVSQGIAFPLSILPNGNYKEGQDVTKLIGIKKYDPEGDKELALQEKQLAENKSKITRYFSKYSLFRKILILINPKSDKGWPKFIKKTDETRLQVIPNIVRENVGEKFWFTEKVDGQSATYALIRMKHWFGKDTFKFIVCSRNLRLSKPDNSSYWSVARKFDIEDALKYTIKDEDSYIILQGEIIGPNIQANKYRVNDYFFYAFNLIRDGKSLPFDEMHNALSEECSISCVPFLGYRELLPSVDEMVDFANDESLLAKTPREGVVVRNYEKGISFKVISPNFLLKYNKE